MFPRKREDAVKQQEKTQERDMFPRKREDTFPDAKQLA